MSLIGHAGLHDTFGELLAGRFWWLLPLVSLALGLILGRWFVIVLPALIWFAAVVFLKLNNGWHGFGWGDFGIEWNVIVALASLLAVAVGVLSHRAALSFLARLKQPRRNAR